MQVRNLKYSSANQSSVDMDIEHPVLGWVRFTACGYDPEAHGRQLFAEAKAGKLGPIAAYTPPPAPSEAEQDATARAQRTALLASSDWTQLPDARRSMGAELASRWDAYRQALRDLPDTPGWPSQIAWPASPAPAPAPLALM